MTRTPDVRRDDGFGSRNRFLTDTPPRPARGGERTIGGLTLSLGAHVAALLVAAVVVSHTPSVSDDSMPTVPAALVYTLGSGNDAPPGGTPIKPAVRSGPTPRRGDSERLAKPQPVTVMPSIIVPEQQINAGLREAVGLVSGVGSPDFGTRGSGPGGDGPGPGTGSGIEGPGGGGEGQRPGNGVSWPKLIVEIKPNYTAEAMRARIEGVVELEIVVRPDGSVGRVRMVRSLDARFGLDEEAMKAVRGWRFDPARHLGKPVQVQVPVEVSFRLR